MLILALGFIAVSGALVLAGLRIVPLAVSIFGALACAERALRWHQTARTSFHRTLAKLSFPVLFMPAAFIGMLLVLEK